MQNNDLPTPLSPGAFVVPSEKLAQLKEDDEWLTDPNYSKTGDPQPIDDKDFTDATNDISGKAKKTLGQYLASKTKKNAYPISNPISDGFNEATVNARGAGGVLSDPGINNQKAFVTDSKSKETLQSSGLGVKKAKGAPLGPLPGHFTFFSDTQLNELISKTSKTQELSGDTLLKGVPHETMGVSKDGIIVRPVDATTGDSRGIKLLQAVHDQLSEGNMYAPKTGQPFIRSVGGKNEEEVTHGLFSIQRDLGSFDKNGKRVQVSDMSAMAMALLLRAVGNQSAANSVLNDKSLGGIGATALIPFLRPPQFGAGGNSIDVYGIGYIEENSALGDKIAKFATGQKDFIAIQSDMSIVSTGTPPNNDNLPNLQSTPHNGLSYAQMNSFLEPFGSKFSSLGMILLAAASIAVILLVAIGISLLIGIFASAETTSARPDKPLDLPFGKHKNESVLFGFFARLLEITDTDYPFGECVRVGSALLYGLPANSESLLAGGISALLPVAENLVFTPAYYANFNRRIVAEGTQVVGAFAKVNASNLSQGFENFLKGIEALVSSATYKFIMIAAGVGDAAMKSEKGMKDVNENQKLLPDNINPYSETMRPDMTKKIAAGGAALGIHRRQVNRWNDGQNSLSLNTFLAAQKQLPKGIITPADNNRYLVPSRENVQKIEDALESEYMPFYIHDLRTHEVMSMPAFITEFGESFAASYNSVKGIGRQDAVMLYNETTRSVTFGFMLVAFNENDHDHLWMTINKLVAMCYPQYSVGRIRRDGNNMFIQPFSQVRAASPMVRLRLGDVFKSNYSKFGLARLFGLDSPYVAKAAATADVDDAQEQGELLDAKIKVMNNIYLEWLAIKKNPENLHFGVKVKLNSNKAIIPRDAIATIVQYTPTPVKRKGKGTIVSHDYRVTVPKLAGGERDVTVSIKEIEYFAESEIMKKINADSDVKAANEKIKALVVKFPDSSFFKAGESGKPEGNAIVRSFETTRGRGVAGFITSLGLDYGMGNYPWEIKQGSRAPMVVKISLGFSPITDLPLGLDADGNINNPSHPVGNLAGSFGDPYSDFEVGLPPKTNLAVTQQIKKNNEAEAAEFELSYLFPQDSNI